MEGLILLVVAVAALGALAAGLGLLVLYTRAGSRRPARGRELARAGALVRCPRCGSMNPSGAVACATCRLPLGQGGPSVPSSATITPAPSTVDATVAPLPGSTPVFAERTSTPAPGAQQPPPDMPRAWLEGVSGVMLGHTVMLTRTDTLVGRSTVCDVQVFDPKVSRRHFMIRFGNGAFYLQDQQSSRGTLINGERVLAQRLNNGDRIDFGDTSLIFHVE